ncbi:ATPase family AAA domain-containing protein 5b [Solea solea]|uniref:ATPase family AAA domain-containing protein 5b n=1 Tax=Solea solea TaxID=90069 RepID=UPI00272BB720|nr:ATPase family AAA domain-containing protein 5b [Solea solea]
MRNKLKRNTNQAQIINVRPLALAVSSHSGVDSQPKRKCGSAATERKAQPLQEQHTSRCVQYVKLAPIFLHTSRQRTSKCSGDIELYPSEEKLHKPAPRHSQVGDLRRVKSRHQFPFDLSDKEEIIQSTGTPLSPSSLQSCLEEIQTTNPTFPVQTVFSTLRKKTRERLQHAGSTENSLYPSSSRNNLKEKRKRGEEIPESESKRLRCRLRAEGGTGMEQCHLLSHGIQECDALPVKKPHWSSKLSHTHRQKQKTGSLAGPVNNYDCTNDTECELQSSMIQDSFHREASFEDVLWTDKYSPQCSNEVIGNHASVNKLHSWLKKWKRRADCEERTKMEERKDEENRMDSWDCGDFRGETGTEDDRDEPLCNTMLITGPPGVGKTASVYACAQELHFKVFEVNCSSQRNGRHVLAQLKEATQSHLVETSGKDLLKPTYLNNYSTSSCTTKSETLPGKPVAPKYVSSKKRAAQSFGRSSRKGKAKPATVTLANYFKMKAKADQLHSGGLLPFKKPDGKDLGSSSADCDQPMSSSKKTATSLILFEEVDVIFDDDVGFLTAIKTFMATTKRPVILTTNDPLFRERFSCSVEEIIFTTPPAVNICTYLQLLCLAENVQLELDDVRSLLRQTCGDVRRCLLQLQLWVHSGGGRASQSGRLSQEHIQLQYSDLPRSDTSCTASMLGLQTVTQKQLLSLLKCQHWSETNMKKLLGLLAKSWRGGEPLLYNNMELLMPKATSVQDLDTGTCRGPQNGVTPSDTDRCFLQRHGGVSLNAPAASVKNINRLSRRKRITKVCDSSSFSTLTHSCQRTSLLLNWTHSGIHRLRDKTEQISVRVETDCLVAASDFFDLMSYLDVALTAAAPLASGSPEAFVWTGAKMRDGLLDEMNEEEEEKDSTWSQERLLDMKTAAEGLGFHRCWWRTSQAWSEAQKHRQDVEDEKWEKLVERLAFPPSSERQSLRFMFQPPCEPSASQRRYELSRKVLGSRSFSLLGNRRAVCVDYMPVLRSICRFHRAQQQKEEPARCLNYLKSLNVGLSKSTIQFLAEEFSQR